MIHHRAIRFLGLIIPWLAAVAGLAAPAGTESHSAALRSFEGAGGSGGGNADTDGRGSDPDERESPSNWDDPPDASLTVSLDYRYPLTGDYRSIYLGRVMFEGSSSGPHALGFSLAAGGVHLKSGSRAAEGAHDPFIFESAVHYRLYFTHPESALRPYGSLMLGVSTLYWDYRTEPVSGGETVTWDAALGFNAYVGAGLLVNLTQSFQMFAEMGYGGIGFLETTSAELKNELFDSFGYVAIWGGLGCRF